LAMMYVVRFVTLAIFLIDGGSASMLTGAISFSLLPTPFSVNLKST